MENIENSHMAMRDVSKHPLF